VETELITTLADGRFHSGQALGELLGVSRAAVWKHLQKLQALGLEVESVKGRGYRLPGGIELLDKARIGDALAPQVRKRLREILIFQSLDSTNTRVASLGEEGAAVVCLAEQQSGGRGRRGRSWSSPFGRNIYLSLGWSFEGGAASLEGLSLAVGIALRRALGNHPEVRLKWPNDLLFEGRKLAGVLIEMQGDPSGHCQVVIGVGINLGMAGRERVEIDQPWADAQELGAFSRNGLVADVLNALVPALDEFSGRGFAAFHDEWQQGDACIGKPVRLLTPALEIRGVARGVAANGAICIEVDGLVREYNGGEISLRTEP